MAARKKSGISRREFLKRGAIVAGAAVGLAVLGKLAGLGGGSKDSSPAATTPWKWSKEVKYYLKMGNNVQCQTCPHRCVLEPGQRGICRDKQNFGGVLYNLAYGNPNTVHVDPIEKKPLFHFLPGTTAFSLATAGCNFRCLNCQNWQISQSRPEDTENTELFPEAVVSSAKANGCASIAYTYSEPTAFYEYMLDTSRLARKEGMRNVLISNGYINEEPLSDLCDYLDAANINLKAFDEGFYNKVCSGRLDPVLQTLQLLKRKGVWLEVTNLVIPTLNDDEAMIKKLCGWVADNLGADQVLHFLRFHPDYKLQSLPSTPVATLERAREIAMSEGLRYVYIGNVPGNSAQNTFCPADNSTCVGRDGFAVTSNLIKGGICQSCGEKIPGIWS